MGMDALDVASFPAKGRNPMTEQLEKSRNQQVHEILQKLTKCRVYTVEGDDVARYSAPSKIRMDAAKLIKHLNSELNEEIQSRKVAAKKAYEFANYLHQVVLGLQKIIDAKGEPCDKFCGHYLELQRMARDILQQIPKASKGG